MSFGLTGDELRFIRKTLVEPLVARGARVYVFGSRARGDHRRFSDVDILVESEADLSAVLAEIREILEESRLPYQIDIVTGQSLADAYRLGVEAEKVPLDVT